MCECISDMYGKRESLILQRNDYAEFSPKIPQLIDFCRQLRIKPRRELTCYWNAPQLLGNKFFFVEKKKINPLPIFFLQESKKINVIKGHYRKFRNKFDRQVNKLTGFWNSSEIRKFTSAVKYLLHASHEVIIWKFCNTASRQKHAIKYFQVHIIIEKMKGFQLIFHRFNCITVLHTNKLWVKTQLKHYSEGLVLNIEKYLRCSTEKRKIFLLVPWLLVCAVL